MKIPYGVELGEGGMRAIKTGRRPLVIKDVLALMATDWPVKNENGHIEVAPQMEGINVQTLFVTYYGFSEELAATAAKLLDHYVHKLNDETATLRQNTKVTTTPELVMRSMREPESFIQTLGWNVLKNNLEASGAIVKDLSKIVSYKKGDEKDTERTTWTRDHYILAPNGTAIFLPYEASNKQLRPELLQKAADFREAAISSKSGFDALGIPTQTMTDSYLQGGDVLQHPKSNTVFVGVNVDADGKTDDLQVQSAHKLATLLGMKLSIIPKTQRADYYHLDTFMSVLPDGSVVLLPDATTAKARDAIMTTIRGHGELLELPAHPNETESAAYERRKLATNIITVNGNSFTSNALPETKAFMAKRGLNLIEGPYSWGSSGPHCQVNFLKRGEQNGRSDVALGILEGLPQLAYQDLAGSPDQFTPSPISQSSTEQTQLS